MPLVQRKRRVYVLLHALRPVLLGLLVVGLLGGLYRFLSSRGPRKIETGAPAAALSEANKSARAQEVAALDARLLEIAALENPGAAERAWLETSRESQRAWLRQNRETGTADSERLRLTEELIANISARALSQKVTELETAAAAGPRDATAGERYREALKLQQEINRSAANARWKDLMRERRLQYEAQALAAEALAAEVETASAEAEAAMKAQRWSDAEKAYVRAREAQGRINRDFGGTRFVDLERERKFLAEIASLASAAAADSVRRSEAAAESAVAAGRHEDAAKFFAEAKARQEALNAAYPASRFASTARLDELEARRQSELSAPLCEKISELDREIAAAFRAGNVTGAAGLLGELAVSNEDAFRKFPRSQRLDAALRKKTAYLASRRSVLAQVHAEVSARLRPIPGTSLKLLAGEVPQRLFTLVAGSNPSRHSGEDKPVDSVGWGDAQLFCQQLSWLLGRTVRLPDENEFRAAWREVADAPARDAAATKLDATQATARDNARFEDLRGNVAEWLQAPPEAPDAPVIGGSYLDTPPAAVATAAATTAQAPEAARELPSQRVAKTERARYIGFRIVVE